MLAEALKIATQDALLGLVELLYCIYRIPLLNIFAFFCIKILLLELLLMQAGCSPNVLQGRETVVDGRGLGHSWRISSNLNIATQSWLLLNTHIECPRLVIALLLQLVVLTIVRRLESWLNSMCVLYRTIELVARTDLR